MKLNDSELSMFGEIEFEIFFDKVNKEVLKEQGSYLSDELRNAKVREAVDKQLWLLPKEDGQFDVSLKEKIIREVNSHLNFYISDSFVFASSKKEEPIVVEEPKVVEEVKPERKSTWWSNRHVNINYHWNAYKQYLLKEKGLENNSINDIDDVTSKVMNLIGNPKDTKPFQKRGLVIGEVQSGKTGLYTAICNKAADAGYDVIIVLSGILELLRQQTQSRLDCEFTGYTKSNNVTVIYYNKSNSCSIVRATNEESDFTGEKAVDYTGKPVFFVLKKNKTILDKVISCLKDRSYDNCSLLVIDDEADNASLNTNKDTETLTSINANILKLLKRFKKSSYVAVTATPFANMLCDASLDDDKNPNNLFPRDFIILKGSPENYIGLFDIFSVDYEDIPYFVVNNKDQKRKTPKYASSLIPILDKEQDDYFKYSHKKTLTITSIPDSLKDAICYFVMSSIICDLKGVSQKHRTMLINVSRYTNVHENIKYEVCNYVSMLMLDFLSDSKSDEYSRFINTFNKLCAPNTDIKLDDVIPWVHETLSATKILTVNSNQNKNENSGLEYNNNKPSRYIAIGGLSLSRGLTLEGLIVSYLYRNTLMSDALLQMGRWFGYRDGYQKLFRLWIGQEIIDRYNDIATQYFELLQDVRTMNDNEKTPRNFALKIRSMPGGLLVTALNKMRLADTLTIPQRITGKLIDTPSLINDIKTINDNNQLCMDFLQGKNCSSINNWKISQLEDHSVLIKDVDKHDVAALVKQYQSHPWAIKFNAKGLSDYILDTMDDTLWDAVVISRSKTNDSGREEKVIVGDSEFTIQKVLRSITVDPSFKGMINISGSKKRLPSGRDAKYGLSTEQMNSVLEKGNSGYLSVKGRRPLLAIYVVQFKDDEYYKKYGSVYALALGFPGALDTKKANYVINGSLLLENIIDGNVDDNDI